MFTTNIYEIPLKPENQTFRINLNGTDYTFTLRWNSRAAHWILNIGDTFGNPLINGIPLVIGVNLLAGYKSFSIGGIGTNLFIRSIAESFTAPNVLPIDPNFDDLGTKTRLYFGINIPDNQLFIPGQNDFRPLPILPSVSPKTRFILFDESCHLFVSEDFGATWAQYDSPPGTMHDGWDHLAMAINDDDYITISGQDPGRSAVTISTVEGFTRATLHDVDTGTGLAITNTGQTIIVGGRPPYISRDKGINWTAFSPDAPEASEPGPVPGYFPQEVIGQYPQSTGGSQWATISCPTLGAGMPSPIQRFTVSVWQCNAIRLGFWLQGAPHGSPQPTSSQMYINFTTENSGSSLTNQASINLTALNGNTGTPILIIGDAEYDAASYELYAAVPYYLEFDAEGVEWQGAALTHFLLTIDFIAQTVVAYANDHLLTHTQGSWHNAISPNVTLEAPWMFGKGAPNTGVSDIWLSPLYLDITDVNVRRQFINADLSAVPLPSDGHITVGGSAVHPVVFLSTGPSGSGADFASNKGTGPAWQLSLGTLDLTPLPGTCIFPTPPNLGEFSAVAFGQNATIAYMWGNYDGKVWKSSDNLISWTELLSSDSYELISRPRLRCSKDGNIVAVGDVNSGDWYISLDGGTTWVYTSFQNIVDPGYDKSINYFDFGMSVDGSVLLAIVSGYDDIAQVDFGMAWTSSDHGATWIDRNLPTILDSADGYQNPDAIVCNVSPDGKYMLVGYSSSENGQAAISIDSGATWISCDFPMDNSQSGAGFWVDSYVVTGVPALIQQAFAQGIGEAFGVSLYGHATQLSGTNIYRLGVPTVLDAPTAHAVVDSGLGLLSVWLVYYSAVSGNPGDLLNIQPVNTTSGPITLISISPYNHQMTIQLEGVIGGSNVSLIAITVGNFDLSTWRHICISWDTNHPAGQKILQVYVNGVQQSFLSINDTSGPFLVNYASSILEYSFFESHFYNGQGYGEIYDFWFAPGQFLDLSVPGNLERFRTDVGAAPGLGANGEFPTGIPPSFFFHKDNYNLTDAYVFPVNQGTGGAVSYSVAAFSISETAPVDVVGTPLPPRGTAAGHATVIGIAPPTPPILLVHFDGTSGSTTFTDTAGGHTLTPTGATVNTSAPKFGTGAGSFTASSGRIVLNNPASFNIGTNPFTIDAWIRFTSAPNGGIYGILTQFGGSSNLGWFLGQVSGQAAFYYSTSGFDNPNIGATFTPTLNTWYHLAVDRDTSNVIRVYLNGAIIASATVTSAIFASTQACVIGNDNNNVRAFPGYIDELRMVLGQAMYGGAFTPPTAPYTP